MESSMSFSQIFSRIGRIARSYGAGEGSHDDELRRAQELIDEAKAREERVGWEAALGAEESRNYRRACAVLQINPGAPLSEASIAYRRSIVLVHPDHTAHLPAGEQERARLRTQELNWAYTIIKEYFAVR
jgi:hypothetical protein